MNKGSIVFDQKPELQEILHQNPNLIANGILEISPLHNTDHSSPLLISLGKNLSFNNTVIDNAFIDAHGVLTLVSCQLYGSQEFSRNLYAPTVNFAADLKAFFIKYSRDFEDTFNNLLQTSGLHFTLQDIIHVISQDPFLERYEGAPWKKYFKTRLQQNLKEGYFRLVLVCAPNMTVSFDRTELENLMRSMTFSESKEKHYDLVLLDLREQQEQYQTSMIWRSYTELPHMPIIEKRLTQSVVTSLRDEKKETKKEDKRDEEKKQEHGWSDQLTKLWEEFSDGLLSAKISMRPNSYGYSLNRGTSLYILVCITPETFFLRRDRILRGQYLYEVVASNQVEAVFPTFSYEVVESNNRLSLRLYLSDQTTAEDLLKAVNIVQG